MSIPGVSKTTPATKIIDADTGLLSIPESEKTIFECFKEGTAPTEYTKKPGTITGSGEFFKLDM